MANKVKEEYQVDPTAWMVTFSDLVTLLLTFFVLLLSMSSMDEQKASDIASKTAGGTMSVVIDSGDYTNPEPRIVSSIRIISYIEKLSRKLVSAERKLVSREEYQKYMWHMVETIPGEDPPPASLIGDIPGRVGQGSSMNRLAVAAVSGGIRLTLPESFTFAKGEAEVLADSSEFLKVLGRLIKRHDLYAIVNGHTDNKDIYSSRYPSNWELSCARSAAVVRKIIQLAGVAQRNLAAAGYADTRPLADNATEEGREINRRVEIFLMPSPETPLSVYGDTYMPDCPFCPADPGDRIHTGQGGEGLGAGPIFSGAGPVFEEGTETSEAGE